jgi:HK97 family phage prohead protease
LAERIFNVPLLIHPDKLDAILSAIGPRIGIDPATLPPAGAADFMDPDEDSDDEDPLANDQGVAILGIHGTLVRRGAYLNSASGLRSYEGIKASLQKALDDSAVQAIVLDIDSAGGEASGVDEVSDMIHSARGAKPIIAIANDSAYSAAYWIASAADKVLVTKMGGVGSIGVYALHADISGWDSAAGIKYTYIFSGKQKVEGNPHEPLSDKAQQRIQDQVDGVRQMFVQAVARNRSVEADKIYKTEAGIFMGTEALSLLADQVGTLEDALNLAASMIKASRSRQMVLSGEMSENEQADLFCGAIGPHKTATSDKGWDGPANERRLKLNQNASYYRRAYAWQDGKGDPTKKASYRFIHHEVSGDGNIGAANIQGCRTGIGVLNGARGGTTIPSGDKKGVYNHLAKHIRDAGLDPPDYHGEAADLISIERAYELYAGSNELGVEAILADESIFALRRFGNVALKENDRKSEVIYGLLAPYSKESVDLGGFTEIFQPGCFAEWIKSGDDAQILGFHNPEHVLGRRSNGTARFYEDAAGLHYEADLPDTQAARDVKVLVLRGDVKESSAGFYILQHRWESRSTGRVRIIEKAWLVEGSPHSFAAYRDSTSAVMPAEEDKAAAEHELELLGARLRILRVS